MKKNECIDNFCEWLKEVIEENEFIDSNLERIVEDFNNENIRILLKATILVIGQIIQKKLYVENEEQKLLCVCFKAISKSLIPNIVLNGLDEEFNEFLQTDTKPDYIEDAE